MGLFGLGKRRKEQKDFFLQWQKVLMPNGPNRLVMTDQQLKSFTVQQAKDDIRIIQDCYDIVGRTYKPDTFFSRLNLLIDRSKHLSSIEIYANYAGVPTVRFNGTYDRIMRAYNDIVKWFLIRYHTDVHGNASALKTSKARLNRYQKWYDSLQPYYLYMCSEHIDYIETEYKRHMEKNR